MALPLQGAELDDALVQLVQEIYARAGYWPTTLVWHPDDYADWRIASAASIQFQADEQFVVLAGRQFRVRLDPETPRGMVYATRPDEGE